MRPNYPITELVGTVFKLAQKMKIHCHVLTLSIKLNPQGAHTNGVTGDCLQNLEHLHGNIIGFVLKPNVREIVYQKSHNKCKLTSIVVLCRSFA